MKTLALYVELEHDEATTEHAESLWKSFLHGLPQLGFRIVDTDVRPYGRGDVVPGIVKDDAPKTLKEIRAGIKRLKSGIGGNRVLSQQEMADELGVTRHQIRKALGKA